MEESFVDPNEFVHDEQEDDNDDEDEGEYAGAELALVAEDIKPDTDNFIEEVYSTVTTATVGVILEQQEEASCTTLCTAMPPSQEDLLHLRATNNVPSGTSNSCATQLSSYSHNHSPSSLKQQISLFNSNINSSNNNTTTAFLSAFSDHHSAQSQLSEDGSDMSSHPANSHLISTKPAGHISSSSSPLQFSPLLQTQLYNTEFGQAAQTQLGYGSPGALTHQTSPSDHHHPHHQHHHHNPASTIDLDLHKPSGLSIDIDGTKSDRANTGAAGCVTDIHSGRIKLWGNTNSNIDQDRSSILYQAPLLHSTEIEQATTGSTSTGNNNNDDHHHHHHQQQQLLMGASTVRTGPTQMTENFMSLSNHHQQLYGNYATAKPAQGMAYYADQMDILRVAQPGTGSNRGGGELQQDGSEIYEAEAVDTAALMRGTSAITEAAYGNDRAAMAAAAVAHGYGVATGAGAMDGHSQQGGAGTQHLAIDWGIGNSTSAHELSLMPRAEISTHHSHHHHHQQQHAAAAAAVAAASLSGLQPSSRDSSLHASSLHDNRPLIPFNGLNMMSGQQCTNNNNSVAAALWPQKLAMDSSSTASIHGQLQAGQQQHQLHDQLEHYRVAGGSTAEAAARGFMMQDQAAAQLHGAAGPTGALSLFLPSPAATQQQYRTEQMSVGLQDSCRYSRSGSLSALRNSRYLKAAQQLLDEFCNVGRDVIPLSKPTSAIPTSPVAGAGRTAPGATNNPSPWTADHLSNPSAADHSVTSTNPTDSVTDHLSGLQQQGSSAAANRQPASSSPGSADHSFPHGIHAKQLPPDERYQLQMRKLRLIGMVEELDRRYQEYRDKMQLIITSFESATGLGAAAPYTALARRVISRQFRGLRDAISDHIHRVCKALGEEASSVPILNKGETPRLRILDQRLRHQRALQQIGMFQQQQVWRPQRGLPERSVSVLRAWLFEHFLHPYPKDSEKLMLARLTGLTRNQVSNWFINARVRLWKPMVEQMYLEETKELELMNEGGGNAGNNNTNNSNSSNSNNSTGQPNLCTTATAAPSTPQYTSSSAGLGIQAAKDAATGGLHGTINSYNYNMQIHSDTRSPNESFGTFFKQAGYGGMPDSGRIDHDPASTDHDQQMHRLQLMQAAAAQSPYDAAGSMQQQHANSMMIKELGLQQQQVSMQPYSHHDAGQFQLMAQMQQHQHQMESQLNFMQQQPSGGYNNSNFHSTRSGVSLTLELQNSASSADHHNTTINFHRLQQAAAGSLYTSNNSSSPTNTSSQLYGRSIRF